jgi:D-hydroxyproline dehydrogenase subunit gamma
MFRSPPDPGPTLLTVRVDDVDVQVQPGESAASAALAVGAVPTRRSAISGEGRAPYCMMGVCFECLLDIDGVPDQRGCMVEASAGMVIRRRQGQSQP